jgi:hypothetical protein
MLTVFPMMGTYREGMAQNIRNLSRYKHGQERDIIMKEIANRKVV